MTSLDLTLYREALSRFDALYARVQGDGRPEPTAVALATADARGQPAMRTVLLKGVDERGFVFYTNANSRKGQDLAVNPRAAMLFFWQSIFEQVEVEGPVEQVSDAESDAYWATRSRASRIGAWASDQSATLGSRAELEARIETFEVRFDGADVPRPAHWYGYRIVPERLEFWQSGPHRVHDRQSYELGPKGWTMRRLNP